ncbi:MAG: hypothetical protein IPO62_17760 [Saprospiraceae bacterium]|nr:hypothetical protein [Saprospiraceae bacterium]
MEDKKSLNWYIYLPLLALCLFSCLYYFYVKYYSFSIKEKIFIIDKNVRIERNFYYGGDSIIAVTEMGEYITFTLSEPFIFDQIEKDKHYYVGIKKIANVNIIKEVYLR